MALLIRLKDLFHSKSFYFGNLFRHISDTTLPKGKIYDKKPFKFTVEKGKMYKWCNCGHSHQQPFCDNSHTKAIFRTTLEPIMYKATETKDIWFCNCKQTNKKPFCDGSHKHPDIQTAIR